MKTTLQTVHGERLINRMASVVNSWFWFTAAQQMYGYGVECSEMPGSTLTESLLSLPVPSMFDSTNEFKQPWGKSAWDEVAKV